MPLVYLPWRRKENYEQTILGRNTHLGYFLRYGHQHINYGNDTVSKRHRYRKLLTRWALFTVTRIWCVWNNFYADTYLYNTLGRRIRYGTFEVVHGDNNFCHWWWCIND